MTEPAYVFEPEIKPNLRVSQIYELRERIFVNLEQTALAQCARVCTLWSDDALNLLWNKLGSVAPLLSVIRPLIRHVRNDFTKEYNQVL